MNKPAVLVTICAALLILPSILFSSLAGQLADKYSKATLITYTKIAEIGIMSTAFYGFATENVLLLMGLLFVSGTHTTFFGPIKYSILPELLSDKEMLAGNGFVSGGNFLAVLLGLIAGAILIEYPGNIIGLTAVGIAFTGFFISLLIPRHTASDPHTEIHYNLWTSTKQMITFSRSSKTLFSAIMGISWFLMIGSVYMTQFANFAKEVLHADNEVYTAFLTLFSIGIAIGALLADQILKGEITAKLSPWALAGVSLFTIGMVLLIPPVEPQGLSTVAEFFNNLRNWPMLGCIIMVALSGGVYMVPLYAIMQTLCEPRFRSRVIAASNMFDSLFMASAAIISAILLHWGFGITDLFLLLAAANLVVFLYARRLTSPPPTPVSS